MNSIRRQLLLLTLTATTLGSLLIAVVAYLHSREELNELYDAHLKQLARTLVNQSVALHLHPDGTDVALFSGTPAKLNKEENFLIQLWTPEGKLYYSSQPEDALPLSSHKGSQLQTFNGELWRMYRADNVDFYVQVAQPESARHSIITETALKMVVPMILQIPILALLTGLAVRRGLQPLNALSRAIKQRHSAALDPLPADNVPDELQPLVQALNDLLYQLQRALERQQHFIADAAHELRTPLAALQLQLDLLKRAQTDSERAQSITDLGAGIRRAAHLVNQLLITVRSEQTETTTQASAVDLERLAAAVVEELLPLANARQIDLGFTRLEKATVIAVSADLRTVLTNLTDNAIRYTQPGGRVDVAVYSEGGAVLEITDTGSGIPIAERARIFDRFYRIPGTSVEGSGLGLAIVKANCDRYGATLAISDNPAQRGTRFTIHFAAAGTPT